MVDKMFQQIIDKGLKPSTAAGAKRVLSVALSHARKYRYIETNAAKDTLTKFGKNDKTPDPYTPEQVKALMQRVEGTVWEMPVLPQTACHTGSTERTGGKGREALL
ncbi:hypothetical protein C823_002657 [Eubacterium plexicaudatum ASF492]|uniref:Integrase n=1 Tax=Eubacterium plexicaudatum ASF492 TaxID=1235802 RepID=N2A3K8_9FIRM|nr:hypothetical protein C823_002657 [Eubacterium plexicaudatum ASF492]